MYLEFFYLIIDYLKTITKSIFLFEWVLPFIISILIFLSLYFNFSSNLVEAFKNNSINLLGILIGFSITIITILTTGQSRNLEEIKKHKTKFIINNKQITLYKLLLINFTYSVVVEVFLVIIFLIYPIINSSIQSSRKLKIFLFSILVFILIHILFLTIRNLTDFYFILSKEKKQE